MIASPRILRPIYTHTPATGFPYPGGTTWDRRRSRIAVLSSGSRCQFASNGAMALPPSSRGRFPRTAGVVRPFERTPRAGSSRRCFGPPPSSERDQPARRPIRSRGSRSTSRATPCMRCVSRHGTTGYVATPRKRVGRRGGGPPVFRASRIDPPAHFRFPRIESGAISRRVSDSRGFETASGPLCLCGTGVKFFFLIQFVRDQLSLFNFDFMRSQFM